MLYSIRQARTGDYEELCDLFAKLDDLHREALPELFRKPDGPARAAELISSIVADQNALLLVAESQGRLVGLVLAFLEEVQAVSVRKARRSAVIEDLFVREDARRYGIGRSLMQDVHQWACAKGLTDIELNVWEFNQGAIAFYERLGYGTTNRRMAMRL